MHQRSALHSGEYRRIEFFRQFLVIGEDGAAARPAQRFVRRCGHDMRMRQRARMRAAGNEAGKMRHVHHQIGTDFVGNVAEAAKVDDARIGRATGDDHLRMMLFGEPLNLIHVDEVIVAAHAVRHHLEPAAGQVDRRTVGEMATRREIESHKGIAGLHQRHEHFGIGGRAGMRLHIGEAAAEQAGRALDRQPFGGVDELAAAVIALARQTFGIFVGEYRALRLKHRAADDVFRRDQFDVVALPAEFEFYRFGDFRIAFAKRSGEEILVSRRYLLTCWHVCVLGYACFRRAAFRDCKWLKWAGFRRVRVRPR